jgi:hypothetical protein
MAVKNRIENGVYAASPCRKGRCGRKRVYDCDEIKAEINKLPKHLKQTYRGLAATLGISKTPLERMMRTDGAI